MEWFEKSLKNFIEYGYDPDFQPPADGSFSYMNFLISRINTDIRYGRIKKLSEVYKALDIAWPENMEDTILEKDFCIQVYDHTGRII